MKSVFTDISFMKNPFPLIDELREKAPLVQVRLPIIGKVWITTTQEAAGAVLKNGDAFSVRRKDGSVTGTKWWMPRSIFVLSNNMLTMDEPDHTRLRSLVDRTFRRDFIMGLEPFVQETADRMARELLEDDGDADLIKGFARKLPLSVICEMLGLPEKDRPKFEKWAEALTTVDGIFSFLFALRPMGRMRVYLENEINRQKTQPGAGLIGQLVEMQKGGADISDDELVATVFLLLVAGHETTTHVISGGVFELLRNEEQRKRMMEDDSRIALAVEELLRFISAVQFTKPRNVRKDVTVDGVRLSKGDVVMAMIAAGNADPAVFECPHLMRLDRKPNRHIAFGAGPHFCLGHQLARLEIACALRALFGQYPDLQLAVPPDEIKWRSRVGLRVIEELRVKKS